MKRIVTVLVLAAAAISQQIPHGVTLTWAWAGVGPTTFNVYRATASGAEAKPALASGLASPTYTDGTAVIGTKYFYTVTATAGGVESAPSAEVGAQIVQPPAPANPATAVY
jgi:fibronectin type 3 domain-containing protein